MGKITLEYLLDKYDEKGSDKSIHPFSTLITLEEWLAIYDARYKYNRKVADLAAEIDVSQQRMSYNLNRWHKREMDESQYDIGI